MSSRNGFRSGDFVLLTFHPQLSAPKPSSWLWPGTYRDVCMELDEKMLPLETQFANFGPVEGVDLCIALQGQTQQLQLDGATCQYRNAVSQGLSSLDTASDSNAALGAGERVLGFAV